MTANFTKVARVDEIPVGEMKAMAVNHHNILLVHTEDGIFALADECSHDSEPLNTGRLKGNQLICTRHGARFDVKSGAVLAPPAVVGVDSYEVRIDNNDIYVLIV